MVVSANVNLGKRFEPARIKIDIRTLTLLCKYILQDVRLIRMEHLVQVRRLLSIIDRSIYENDPDMTNRINFLFKAVEARLDNNITDMDLILVYINGGINFKVDFLDYNNLIMNKNDVQYCHTIVENLLKYSFFFNDSDKLQEYITEFKVADISNKVNAIVKVEELLNSLHNKFRQCHVEQNLNDTFFSLEEGIFENAVTDTYNMVTNPSRRLLTGMQGLNEMIGGGFESGRVYMFLGVAGVGKSLTLLNIITQIKRHNIRIKAKDPTKKPCIVLLTMENTVVETITRLYDMVINNSKGMGNETLDDVIYKLRTEGELRITESSPLDIIIRYKANRSVSTDYLYSLYDDLMDQGKEPVCLIQDHIKRIRSVNSYGNNDVRLELGETVNEFKVFAADKDIPVITVSHLNREATRVIEEAARKGNQDNGKLLGKSNIGESLLMIDNIDCAIILTRDYDIDGLCYITMNRIKMRDKGSDRSYIAQPFLPDNPIRLVEDIGGIPQFKETLHNAELKHNPVIKMSGSASLTQNLTDVLEIGDNSDNAFSNKDIYTLTEESFDDDISQLIIEESEKQKIYTESMNALYSQLPSENPPRKMISFVRPMVSFN